MKLKGVLIAVGLAIGAGWLWQRKGTSTVTFTVLLGNLWEGSTLWVPQWWDGSQFVSNTDPFSRAAIPVDEAALFKNVAYGPGSYVRAKVTVHGEGWMVSVSLPNPVNLASYLLDWDKQTITRY